MKGMQCSVHINAPRKAVFDVFADIPNCARRIDGIQSIEMLVGPPVGVGTRWRETRILFKKEATEEMWISEFDRPNHYMAEAESNGAHYFSTFTFTDAEQGGTQVTMTFEGKPLNFFSKIMAAIMAPMMRKSMTKLLKADMNDLKRAIESEGAA